MELFEKAAILAEFWLEFRDDEDFAPFWKFNDVGGPLSHMINEGMVNEASPMGESMIDQTFKMFLELFEVTQDEVEALDEIDLTNILTFANEKKGLI